MAETARNEYVTAILNVVQAAVFAVLTLGVVYLSYNVAMVHGDILAAYPYYKMPDADFTNVWCAGMLARQHGLDVLYSSQGFLAWKEAYFHHPFGSGDWLYPPPILPLGYILSFMPLPVAFYVWNIGTFLGIGVVLRCLRMPWAVVLLVMFSPAEYRCLCFGQFGGMLGCLAFAGLMLAERRPVMAGVMLGLVTMKPQPGVIVPIAWLAARRWRAIVAAGITCAALIVFAMLLLGPRVVSLYFTNSAAMVARTMQAPFGAAYQTNGVSVYWMLRSLGASNPVSYACQLAGAAAAAALVYRAWRLPGANRIAQIALTLILSLFIMPYAFAADMVGYSIAVVALAWDRGWRVTLLDGVLWLWPGYIVFGTVLTGVLLTPVALAAASVVAWRQLKGPSAARR